MAFYIVHSSIDERGKASGGAAGDQTGREVCTRTYYNKPWGMVLRYCDPAIAKKARDIAIKLANSNLVGYDQSGRNTLYKELEKNGWDVDKYIASGVKTESDCSAFIYACYCCVIASLRGQSNAPTTSTAKAFYSARGFSVLAVPSNPASLQVGDLLNKAGSHIVMYAGTDTNVGSVQPVAQATKSVDEVAQEVIKGLWGDGETRRQRLTSAGYNYEEVRARVNAIYKCNNTPTVSTVQYYPRYTGSSGSIVEGLKAIGIDSSYSNRKAIAIKNNIPAYKGTALQNMKLLQLLKEGRLVK
jgi:hypothetical protein